MVLKHQQFQDSKSDKIEPKGSEYEWLDLHNNKKEKGLDKFGNKDEKKV